MTYLDTEEQRTFFDIKQMLFDAEERHNKDKVDKLKYVLPFLKPQLEPYLYDALREILYKPFDQGTNTSELSRTDADAMAT